MAYFSSVVDTSLAMPPAATRPRDIASMWLGSFADALAEKEPDVTGLFVAESWWRDLLSFTWDLRSIRGRDTISSMFAGFGPVGATAFALAPSHTTELVADEIKAHFVFETAASRHRGIVRLRKDEEGGVWRAWALFIAMIEIKGFEEPRGQSRPFGGNHGAHRGTLDWLDQRRISAEFEQSQPEVIIVGAGQGGLCLAARLSMIGVWTLVVERNDRVGDNWRSRYQSLVLHDPVWTNHLPYLPFPDNWPVYTPKDKLADWLESYASIMELNVWTGARIEKSRYSAKAGQRAVIVGASNSAQDIAQDLNERGVDVTILQRSSTYVMSSLHGISVMNAGLYEEGGPDTAEADLEVAALPTAYLLPRAFAQNTVIIAERDADMLSALADAGFHVDFGEDGSGILGKFLRRGGGYFIDVGSTQVIASGEVKVKHGVEVDRVEEDRVIFSDGTSLAADIIVLATGYRNMRETARDILGEEVADRCREVWGLDDGGRVAHGLAALRPPRHVVHGREPVAKSPLLAVPRPPDQGPSREHRDRRLTGRHRQLPGAIPMSSDSKVTIVTGAARGIGESIALRLGRDGFAAVVSDLPAAWGLGAAPAPRTPSTSIACTSTHTPSTPDRASRWRKKSRRPAPESAAPPRSSRRC